MARRNGGFVGQDGLDAPDPPTGVTPTAGEASVSVAFTAPTDTGTSAITGFVVQVSTDDTAYSAGSNTGTSSPIVVSSLTNGTAATAKVWAINAYGTSASSDASASFSPFAIRALFGGGDSGTASQTNVIDFVAIATTGNASDFGDLTVGRASPSALASLTRGVFASGQDASGVIDVIDYVTIASEGNATDFGNLLANVRSVSAMSHNTRGVFSGGYTGAFQNVIQYITIASTGNATDFGDSTVSAYAASGCASPTRGISGGGAVSGGDTNVIESIQINTTGNASDFGDLTVANANLASCSSDVRGVFGGGHTTGVVNTIQYITIASAGNTTDFGDLSVAKQNIRAASSNLRGIFAGGSIADGTKLNVLEYITIASTGNVTDFGNLTDIFRGHAGCSNGHGGLQ